MSCQPRQALVDVEKHIGKLEKFRKSHNPLLASESGWVLQGPCRGR